jgi:hypothetical protein
VDSACDVALRDHLAQAARLTVLAARAAGQAYAAAHMLDHPPHAATYAAKAVGLYGDTKTAKETARAWHCENLAPALRSIDFPQGALTEIIVCGRPSCKLDT